MLTIQELRQLSDQDVLQEMEKASKELLKIRMDLEGGYAKESHKAKQLKRYIARMKTIQRENLTNS
jgi:ribosomal protein L29